MKPENVITSDTTSGTRLDTTPDTTRLPADRVLAAVLRFTQWLDRYGENSYDFQSFFSSDLARAAKALYYTKPLLGTIAVSPMVFCEAFVPSARRLFWKAQRFPIADAHYAMGFALLAKTFQQEKHHKRAEHFLEVLLETRCPGYENYCWGYPFNWETVRGTIREGTPLITTVPYVYEAFKQVYEVDGDKKWREVMRSVAEHAFVDYKDLETSPAASSCSYTPSSTDSMFVVNANAYRAFLLTSASREFSEAKYWKVSERNLNFVLEAQNADGSWRYATDGSRDFVDHFHTCFVMKALAKIEALTGHPGCTKALERGVDYYLKNLFDEQGLPRPFSRRPRLTVYKRELYDYAECINLCILLQGRFPQLDRNLATVLEEIMTQWQRSDGSFRSRKLLFGWDNTPMHRWAASQLFRSLCLLLYRNVERPIAES
ncbi:MAG TPA: hypothetical protein VMU53_00105 [Candidatus Sulfotelmatobacter sp.]|nr:hypothetical protein [Candidatus Sulfotelmatobacter sp.]